MAAVSAPPVRPSRLGAWLLPDFAATAAAAAVFFCFFVFHAQYSLFLDGDTGWHIRTGQLILATFRVPHTDPFSVASQGKEWFAFEWLADCILGAIEAWRGLPALAAFFVAVIAAAVWLWFRLHRFLGGSVVLAAAMGALVMTGTLLHWLARPHVLAWIPLLLTMFYLERPQSRFGIRDGAAAAAVAAAWANLHPSFLLALELALLYAAGRFLKGWLWPAVNRKREFARARWYALAAACGFAGSLLNPWGVRLHAHVAAFLAQPDLLGLIAEWQPTNFGAANGFQLSLTVLLALAGAAISLFRGRPDRSLATVAVLFMAFRAVRGIPIAALLLLPLANAAITPELRRWPRWRGVDMIDAIDGQRRGAAVIAFLLAAVVCWPMLPPVVATAGFPPALFPVAAARALETLPAGSPVLATDVWGGYLIYRFRGALRVFVDGRFDLHGIEPYLSLSRMLTMRPGWEYDLRAGGFAAALLPTRSPLVKGLQQRGWRLLYSDPLATALAAP